MEDTSQVVSEKRYNSKKKLNHDFREVREPIGVLVVVMMKNGEEIFGAVTKSMGEIGANIK